MLSKYAKFLINRQIVAPTILRRRGYKSLVDVHPEIRHSLEQGKPVVALESTIITHGMPYPQNLETAQEVEALVREQGSTPATCALIDGRIKVGLTAHDLTTLSAKPQDQVIKCSRRDLAMIVSRGLSGGTTVSATMIIANMVGVKVFATGGIGGVHRDGHVTMDVSADLVELGRTPVAVVCSGVKSILDIPRTLEFLETQGVCVASYGDAQGRFPDFYTRDSGCEAPYNVDGPKEAAALISSLHEMQLQSGILIGVPIPQEYAADKELISWAIAEAQAEAQRQKITGKLVTPFILAAIAKITKGNSLKANMALIKNNATVAAQIAKELSIVDGQRTGPRKTSPFVEKPQAAPVIVGASILDLSLTLKDDMPAKLDGATYHTVAKQSAGGVGRNIAEGIYKLHGQAHFLSVVGNDELGKSLLHLIPDPLRRGVRVEPKHATSMCSVIFDKLGDCKWILGNMEIHASITPEHVQQQEDLIRAAPLMIIDGNLSLPTMETALLLAGKHKKPVFFEPTDMRIAGKPFQLPRHVHGNIKFISPNIHELKTITETITQQPYAGDFNLHDDSSDTIVSKATQMLQQIEQHFDCILVTLSHHGVLLSLRTASPFVGEQVLFDKKTCQYNCGGDDVTSKGHQQRFYSADHVERVVNVSGAGDSFCSGFITGLLRGYDVDRSMSMGFLAAEKALKSESAVPKTYFANDNEQQERLEDTVQRLKNMRVSG